MVTPPPPNSFLRQIMSTPEFHWMISNLALLWRAFSPERKLSDEVEIVAAVGNVADCYWNWIWTWMIMVSVSIFTETHTDFLFLWVQRCPEAGIIWRSAWWKLISRCPVNCFLERAGSFIYRRASTFLQVECRVRLQVLDVRWVSAGPT